MNVILKALKRAAEKHGNKLPPTLYIQADNCWRENKNRFVFAFLQLLVEKNIFEEVHMSFLIVGHTHEDVDQAFSVFSRLLKKTDIETLPDLLNHFEKSELLKDMFDIKSWILPHIEDLNQISKPLHYKFSKKFGKVLTQYKGQYNSKWIDLENNFLKKIPSGQPKQLTPGYDKIDIELNKKQILTIKSYFQKAESEKFWETFYESLQRKDSASTQAVWTLDLLPRQRQTPDEDIFVSLPEHVNQLLQKETEIPKITLKKKQKPKGSTKAANTNKQKRKNGTSKAGGKKKFGYRKHVRVIQVTVQMKPVDSDVKRHIWIKIFMDLLGYTVKLLLFLFFMLFTVQCLEKLVKYLDYIRLLLLEEHLGNLILIDIVRTFFWSASVNFGLYTNIPRNHTCFLNDGALIC